MEHISDELGPPLSRNPMSEVRTDMGTTDNCFNVLVCKFWVEPRGNEPPIEELDPSEALRNNLTLLFKSLNLQRQIRHGNDRQLVGSNCRHIVVRAKWLWTTLQRFGRYPKAKISSVRKEHLTCHTCLAASLAHPLKPYFCTHLAEL